MALKGWPVALDSVLTEKFGGLWKTEFNLSQMAYVTLYGDDEPMTDQMKLFIEAFMTAVKAMEDGVITNE